MVSNFPKIVEIFEIFKHFLTLWPRKFMLPTTSVKWVDQSRILTEIWVGVAFVIDNISLMMLKPELIWTNTKVRLNALIFALVALSVISVSRNTPHTHNDISSGWNQKHGLQLISLLSPPPYIFFSISQVFSLPYTLWDRL